MLVNTVPSVLNGYLQVGRLQCLFEPSVWWGSYRCRARSCSGSEIPSIKSVFNLYGPSEDTVFLDLRAELAGGRTRPPIGRPVTNTDVHVLDKDLTPVPVGVVGEPYIGGAGLARRLSGTAGTHGGAFHPHPYSSTLSRCAALPHWGPGPL
ncbi:MAG: AMP-binding protein [Zoogloeaceae bacterium]|nr:AMP-binding protein [Zoogloeaceae bacterium]